MTTTIVTKCCLKSFLHLKRSFRSIAWSRRSTDLQCFIFGFQCLLFICITLLCYSLQTQQKHSQWCYAECSLCRDPKWRQLHKMYLVFVCCLGTSLRGDQRNHLKFWEIVILYNYAEENHNLWRTRQDNGPKRVISWIHGSAKFHVELGPVLHNCSSRSHLSSNAG